MGPSLQGIFAVKLPVADLDRSTEWYRRVFGLEVEIEFPDDDGTIGGIAGHLAGVGDTYLALRRDPGRAQALDGANLVNFAVADRAAVESWIDRLDELEVPHSPLIDATVGWMTVLHDPDGLELHLYSRERHDIDHTDAPGYGRAPTA
jgi:catechol 2,3-dioxygenase-like lactoylglutathione lyase family enzyme